MNWKLFVLASSIYIVFENLQKKAHSTLQAKRAALTYWVYKSSWKIPKIFYFSEFLKTWCYGQTVLPDMSTLIGQKLLENVIMKKFKWDYLGEFQQLWERYNIWIISKNAGIFNFSMKNDFYNNDWAEFEKANLVTLLHPEFIRVLKNLAFFRLIC